MVAASFMAWQMGAGNGMEWNRYLKNLGLSDEEPELTPEQRKEIARRAIERAEMHKADLMKRLGK